VTAHASHADKALHSRRGIGLTANVLQYMDLRFSRIAVDRPALILLKEGQKTFQAGSQRWVLRSGDAIAIAAGQTFDVTNQLSDAGLFEARWIVWDAALLDRHQQATLPKRHVAKAQLLKRIGSEFTGAIDRAALALQHPASIPDDVAAHRMTEALVWLSALGVDFGIHRDASTAFRLRRLFNGAVAQDWTVPAVAQQLAMSEATLRRKLATEGASFSALLADVRMSAAMTLLQSTHRSVAQIAQSVGYESASRFAVRFRDRFGFAPTAVRGHRRD